MTIRSACAALAFLTLTVALVPGVAAQAPPVSVPTPGGDVVVTADRMEQQVDLRVATGNVEVLRGTARLTADRVDLNRETGEAVAQGRVVFYDGEDRLAAERMEYNFRTGTGVVHNAETHTAPYYRLSGERLERIGESVYRVRRGAFTTCEDDPPAWTFRFGSATADLNEFVYGSNASFWVRNIPLIPWFPFFAAAIRRERQTGFLFPKFGTSSFKGASAEFPFFWAINDSQDLMFAPFVFEQRGIGANLEYRYLLSADHTGSLSTFYLREVARHDDDRAWVSVRHDWAIAPRLSLKVDARAVTDDELFREYGDPLHQRSQQRVESNVFLTRSWTSWNLVGNAFWYQDLTTRRPTELNRLPDVSLIGVRQPVPGLPGALWEMSANATRFVRDVGSDGPRVDLNPRLSRPISPGGFFTLTPFVGGRLTAYDQRVTGAHISRDGTVTEETDQDLRLRRLVEVGADLETVLSRVYRPGVWGFDAMLHTIEPRVNYVWADGRNMDRLPSWTDTDRVADSNRIEYSMTTRVRAKMEGTPKTEPLRLEVLRLLIGHSIDMKNGGRGGDAVGDLIVQPRPDLTFRGTVRHDTHGAGVQVASVDTGVTIDPVSTSIGWRYFKPEDLSFMQGTLNANVTRNLIARLSTNWDLRENRFLENRYAVDLKFQCFAITVEYVDRSSRLGGRSGEDEVRFAVNLLGLSSPIQTSLGLGALTSGGGTSATPR